MVDGALSGMSVSKSGKDRPSSGRHQMTVAEAVEVWRNEGDQH